MKLPDRLGRGISRPLVVGLTLLAAACSDTGNPSPVAPGGLDAVHRAVSAAPRAQASANQLARAFALAMSEAEVRVQVRNAMRASLFNEHKLVLQDFLHTPAGRRLMEASARASGTPVEELHALVAQLPPMDFYVPFREQRLAWRGTPELAVGATLDQDNPTLTAFDLRGSTINLDSRSGVPSLTLLILHPAERKELRSTPQPAGPGAVIQDPDDGEAQGMRTLFRIRGDSTVFSIASCTDTSIDCTGGEGGGGGGFYNDTLYGLVPRFGDGWGTAEVELTYWNRSWQRLVTDRYVDLQKNVWAFRKTPIPPGEYILTITAVETDAFSDDNWGDFQSSSGRPGPYPNTLAFSFLADCATTGDPNTECTPYEGNYVVTLDAAYRF